MGLDMFAVTTPVKPEKPVDFSVDQSTTLHYWRKHPNLHGWMERLYREKGGSDAQFNCVRLMLDGADLDRLEADVKGYALPETTGPFFGESDGTPMRRDLAFIAAARAAIARGETVYYIAWW